MGYWFLLVEHKDNNLKMVLFLLLDLSEKYPETQAIFERNSSVGGKTLCRYYKGNKRPKIIVSISTDVVILNKVARLNKCPLKSSLVRVSQKLPKVLDNNEDAIFCVIISDYIS
ncbi:21432_t:CDS:2, partial [Dentiscutata erythropus]